MSSQEETACALPHQPFRDGPAKQKAPAVGTGIVFAHIMTQGDNSGHGIAPDGLERGACFMRDKLGRSFDLTRRHARGLGPLLAAGGTWALRPQAPGCRGTQLLMPGLRLNVLRGPNTLIWHLCTATTSVAVCACQTQTTDIVESHAAGLSAGARITRNGKGYSNKVDGDFRTEFTRARRAGKKQNPRSCAGKADSIDLGLL